MLGPSKTPAECQVLHVTITAERSEKWIEASTGYRVFLVAPESSFSAGDDSTLDAPAEVRATRGVRRGRRI
ncbi:hypothetical protein MRX96_005260 [Rhipicephalus microplus]